VKKMGPRPAPLQNKLVARRGSSAAISSSQSKLIAQLGLIIDGSPRMTAQRKLAKKITNSPTMVSRRSEYEALSQGRQYFVQRIENTTQDQATETKEEIDGKDFQNNPATEAIGKLLSYATEVELDAMLGNVSEDDNKENELLENEPQVQLRERERPLQLAKTKDKPRHPGRYTTHPTYGGRTYHHRIGGVGKRTTKFSGPIVYVRGGRKATPKVPYKRKNDAAGHLIAHSFGGPPKFIGNFVAMNKLVNSAGGDWGKMESYIRNRLKVKSTSAYMSVSPNYPNPNSKRPDSIRVTVHFNRNPKKKSWDIQTP